MNTSKGHRRHAVRVAVVATLIVMVFYVVAAIVLNLIVTNHLISTTDHRLADRLEDARQETSGTAAIERAGRGHEPRRCTCVPLVDRALRDSNRLDLDGAASARTSLGAGSGHARHRQLGLPVRHVADPRCPAGGRSEHGRDVERPVDAAGRRARLRRDPGRRRVRRCDGGGSAGLRTVGTRPSPAGRIHRRCLA